MFRRKFQARRRMTREEKAAEELEWRRINEEIELSAEGVEPLLGAYSGYSVEVTAMLIFPFLNMFMMWFPMVRRSVRFLRFLNLKLRRRRRRDAAPPRRRLHDHTRVTPSRRWRLCGHESTLLSRVSAESRRWRMSSTGLYHLHAIAATITRLARAMITRESTRLAREPRRCRDGVRAPRRRRRLP